MSRRIAFLSMPIEALLDILAGRATAKLPVDVPEDSTYLYSYLESEHQILKIALSHEKFDPVTQGGYIKTHKLEIVVAPPPKAEEAPGYVAETLIGTEQWHRDV